MTTLFMVVKFQEQQCIVNSKGKRRVNTMRNTLKGQLVNTDQSV